MILILTILFLILFEAIYEGLKSRGLHIASEWIEVFYLAFVTVIVIMWALGITLIGLRSVPFLKALAGYLLLRFAIFDFIWNIAAGQKIFYIGQTKSYDLFVKWFTTRWGSHIWFVRIVALITGLGLLLKYV